MEELAEFKALEDDEARRQAFQKFIKRQKVRDALLSMLDRNPLFYRRSFVNNTQMMIQPRVANAKNHTARVTALTMIGKETAIGTTATIAMTGIRSTKIASGIVTVTEMTILLRDDIGMIIEPRPQADGEMIGTMDKIVVRTL